MSVPENIASLMERLDVTARRVGRKVEDITLMAVTKNVSPDRIREAYAAGIRVFGENRVQEFGAKSEALRELPGVEWHMIGHLQSNKASRAVELFDSIDSVDKVRLAEKLNAGASQLGRKMPVLIEINIGGEEAKSGVAPDSAELQNLLNSAPDLLSLEVRGLMTVPPYGNDPEQSRPHFRKMHDLFLKTAKQKLPAVKMYVLSMGMSHDFEVAIEEGSTCVRLGTAIFGERPRMPL